MCAKLLQSCPTPCNSMTVACRAPLSMGFSRQEYWSGCHALLQGIFNPGIEPRSPALQADSLPPELPGKPCLRPYNLSNYMPPPEAYS